MTVRIRHTGGVLLLVLSCAAAAAATLPATPGYGVVAVAAERGKTELYRRGFSDGLNGKEARDKDKDYRAGFEAGRERQAANQARADGKDYARGYRDGYDGDRGAAVKGMLNKDYRSGFSAGEKDRAALGSGKAVAAAPSTRFDPAQLVGKDQLEYAKDLEKAGYKMRRTVDSGEGTQTQTTWNNAGTSDCIVVSMRSGRVETADKVPQKSCR